MSGYPHQPDHVKRQLHLLHLTAERLSFALGELWRGMLDDQDNEVEEVVPPSASPCTSCPKYDACTEPCEELLQLLPLADAGKSRRVVGAAIPLDVLQHDLGVPVPSDRDLFQRYEACRHMLTPKRWQAVLLVHGAALSQKEAARKLGKAESTVSELLREAEKTMLAFHARSSRDRDGPS